MAAADLKPESDLWANSGHLLKLTESVGGAALLGEEGGWLLAQETEIPLPRLLLLSVTARCARANFLCPTDSILGAL